MRLVLSALVLVAFAIPAAAATDAELKVMIVGNWADSGVCADGYLMFNADGTFSSVAPAGSPPEDDLKGTYTITDGKLAGMTPEFEMPTIPITFDGEKLIMGAGPTADTLMHCK
jgi:hypothetical protein